MEFKKSLPQEHREVVVGEFTPGHQLAAVSKALERAGFGMIAESLKECLVSGDSEQLDSGKLEKLFLSLAYHAAELSAIWVAGSDVLAFGPAIPVFVAGFHGASFWFYGVFMTVWVVSEGCWRRCPGLAPFTPYWARAKPPFLVVRPKLRSRFRFKPAMRAWIQAWFFTTPR